MLAGKGIHARRKGMEPEVMWRVDLVRHPEMTSEDQATRADGRLAITYRR
jgi:hypothetical protein